MKDCSVLIIMAHPDDEVLWAWPVMQNEMIEKHVFIVADNSGRRGNGPKAALLECLSFNKAHLAHDPIVDSNFYRIPPRFSAFTLSTFISNLDAVLAPIISKIRPDYIMTHNMMGEYGHGDHRFLNQYVTSRINHKFLFTDICLYNKTHLTQTAISFWQKEVYSKVMKEWDEFTLNIDWFNTMKRIYKNHNAWSWGHEPVKSCKLYFS